jgi:hypothetical protein
MYEEIPREQWIAEVHARYRALAREWIRIGVTLRAFVDNFYIAGKVLRAWQAEARRPDTIRTMPVSERDWWRDDAALLYEPDEFEPLAERPGIGWTLDRTPTHRVRE